MKIKDLRKKCQSPRAAKDSWYGLFFVRKLSIYLTVVFIKLRIRATQATFIFMLSGIVAALFFAFGGRGNHLIGALLLQLFYLLDHVDGEVARYNEETSLAGRYFDELVHYIVHPLIFFGIGFGLFNKTNNLHYILVGALSAFSMMLLTLIIDLKNLILLRNFHRNGEIGGVSSDKPLNAESEKSVAYYKKILEKIYLLCSFPVIMNLLTIICIFDFIAKTSIIAIFLWLYSIVLTVFWMLRSAKFIHSKRIDNYWITGDYK